MASPVATESFRGGSKFLFYGIRPGTPIVTATGEPSGTGVAHLYKRTADEQSRINFIIGLLSNGIKVQVCDAREA